METQPTPPIVNLELTPSFPAVVGQKVTINALADSFTEIETISITVNGKALILDEKNRVEYTPDTTGRIEIVATAIDSAGRSNTVTEVLKVRDTEDELAPVVAFGLGLDGAVITNSIPLTGTVLDTNLDEWNLSIVDLTSQPLPQPLSYEERGVRLGEGGNSRIGGNVIASGYSTKTDNVLTQFDPSEYSNGFYTLRLEAVDIKGRESVTEIVVEVNNSSKQKQYLRSDTDLSVTLGGTTLDLVRRYDSLERDSVGSFGNGWELGNSEFNLETSLLRGEGGQAVEDDTRVYLTLPNGERVGFTFAPVAEEITGVTYYKPAWVADEGVNYTLESAEVLLSKAGGRYYDLQTAKPYGLQGIGNSPKGLAPNVASEQGTGDFVYKLTASDNTVYNLDATGSVIEQVTPDGARLIYSDSGILNPATGEMVRFESDDLGRLIKIVAPDGTAIAYSYDDDGNLVGARDLAQGDSVRYSYGDSGLNLIAGDTSEQGGNAALGSRGAGEAIIYNDIPEILPLTSDLGTASSFVGTVTNGTDSELYSFAFRDTEINSTATGLVLLGVDVTGSDELPVIEGLTPVSTSTSTDSSFALFAIESAGLNLLEVNGSGDYQFQLTIAGDVNNDGTVDGVDSGLVTAALGQSLGDTGYDTSLDVNRDGVINATDVQILGSNYGFAFNQAPVVTDGEALTHEDLSVAIPLGDLASDPEGDKVFFRAIEVEDGTVTFAPDGETAIFTPNVGYTGTTTFKLLADDGFAVSDAGVVEVEVSNAPLTGLDFVVRNPRLGVGEQFELQVIGDFADQEDVLLPGDYLTWSSEDEGVANITNFGTATAITDGTTIFIAQKNGLQAITASRIGDIPAPTNDKEFYVALAEEEGLTIYPEAVTLTEGMTRQIQVGLDSFPESPELLSDTETGTSYFVSNPDILEVDSNGLITIKQNGLTHIIVIQGASERIIPVSVENPSGIDSATLGINGGVVQSNDGSTVTIAPNALDGEHTVSINSVAPEDIDLPLPDILSTVGAFELDFGDKKLNTPAQLVIPTSEELEVGGDILFVRLGELPNASGETKPIWLIEESGVVTNNNTIVTNSLPYEGVTQSGKYLALQISNQLIQNGKLTSYGTSLATGIAVSNAAAYSSVAFSVATIGIVAVGTGALLSGLLLYLAYLYDRDASLEVIGIPEYGLPVSTTTNIKLNPDGIPTIEAVLPAPITTNNNPTIEKISLGTDTTYGRVVYLEGSNFGTKLDDIEVDFLAGNKSYRGDVIKEISDLEKIAVTSTTIALGDRTRVRIRDNNDRRPEPERESEERKVPIKAKDAQTIAAQVWNDSISIINALNPLDVVNNTNSTDLVLADIPVGNEGIEDRPRHLAITNNASRAYVPLEASGGVAIVDINGFRQLDANPLSQEDINPIDLLTPNAMPFSIVIGSQDKYAYIGDRQTGSIYVIDIDINSPSYNQHIDTISISGIKQGIAKLAISSDGRLLFATAPGNNRFDEGHIIVVNIDPEDKPYGKARKWHEQIDIIEAGKGVHGIAPTPDSDKIVFTNRGDESQGFGIIEITNNESTSFTTKTPKYIELTLGQETDYFDVNEAVSVTVTTDSEYAFVAARNSLNFGNGSPSIDGAKAGSNIGIIVDPLGDNPKLIAATKPIPNGYTMDLELAHNDDFLYANYPGLSSIFAFDVQEFRETIDNLRNGTGNYFVDHLGRGQNSPIFLEDTKRKATFDDLSSIPIDNINTNINKLASDYQLVREFAFSGIADFGVPENSTTTPIAGFGNNHGINTFFRFPIVNLQNPVPNGIFADDGVNNSLRPTFQWNFNGHPDCPPEKDLDIAGVELYVSVFPEGEGLFPDDQWEGRIATSLDGDGNPNRILTTKWSNGRWTWTGGSTAGSNKQLQLPLERILTAGQTYYWGIRVLDSKGREIDRDEAQFSTLLLDNSHPFSSVTILTDGIEARDVNTDQIAATVEAGGGLYLEYDPQTGEWDSGDENIYDYYGKPLVLYADWISNTSISSLYNTGFAEAAADTLFASLVDLDQSFVDNPIGDNGQIYDEFGNLIRKQGAIFNSPLHFIGFGQGAVVNTEIVQRLGTFYPDAGGTETADGSVNLDRDLHVTTVDPYYYNPNSGEDEPNSPDGNYQNILDPKVTNWENVTFADNYYQQQNISEFKGRELNTADWNVNLGDKYGFDENNPHKTSFDWYTGTADFLENVYRRLGDYDSDSPNSWYVPDHTNADFNETSATNAPWEGIGTGWFNSLIGGDYTLRPYDINGNKTSKEDIGSDQDFLEYVLDKRTSIDEDNTYTDSNDFELGRLRGDLAVPTLFNGNFDAIAYQNSLQVVPGWSTFNNSNNDVSQEYLVDFNDFIPNTAPNYALELGSGLDKITHNTFIVPDWGELNFDLFSPEAQGGNLKVSIKGIDEETWQPLTTLWGYREGSYNNNIQTQRLNGVNLIAGTYSYKFEQDANGDYQLIQDRDESKNNKLGYGTKGFETFTFGGEALEQLRGKPALLEFEVVGASSEVYLDNIFFQSPHLQLGNPTQSRNSTISPNLNNYLVEKPQYSLSYNSETKTPNWVGWQLNYDWEIPLNEGGLRRPRLDRRNPSRSDIPQPGNMTNKDFDEFAYLYPFEVDYALPTGIRTQVYDYSGQSTYDRGHLAASEDRNRDRKDQFATFFMSNMIPMHRDMNRLEKPWQNLEQYSLKLANQGQGKDLHIFAGGYGSNGKLNNTVNIPERLWKIIVVLEKDQSLQDIDGNTKIIAVDMPNSSDGSSDDEDNWTQYITTIDRIEENIENSNGGSAFDFLSNIPQRIIDQYDLKNQEYSYVPLDASLLADTEILSLNAVGTDEQLSTRHNSIVIPSSVSATKTTDSSSQIGSGEVGSNNISISNISSFQVDSIQASTYEIGLTKIGSSEISRAKIGSSEISSTEIDFTEINSIEINAYQINPTEIPFASSISSDQFFSIHNSTPQIINVLNNSATNIWSNLLESQTQLDIDFQITDLPLGQLAEATITGFNENGTPNTGTIEIDHDANGVGWFVDSTPWENSEFITQNTENYFIADPESEANGKYDLLTTILHELAHLYGFIEGYSGFDGHVEGETFISDDFSATLDGEHLDKEAHPHDLLNTHLAPGIRKLPSELDIQILQSLIASEAERKPNNPGGEEL